MLHYYINSGLTGHYCVLSTCGLIGCGHLLTQVQLSEGLPKLDVRDSLLIDNLCYLPSMGSHEVSVKTPTEVLN